jgi:hypothetical protein
MATSIANLHLSMYHSRKVFPWQQRPLAVVVGSGHARASGLARIAGYGHGQHAAAVHLRQGAIIPCGQHRVIQKTLSQIRN